MKVVLFCGGYGMRMRDGRSDVPKPMTTVGPRPLIWHVMRYYAHFGHKDFVLCLGYGAHHVKDYFLNYSETASNDFTLAGGRVELLGSDIQDWNITFVHTGLDSSIGERLRRVRRHVENEEMFLANYADVLTDLPLNDMIDTFKASEAVASLVAVPPQTAFHCVEVDDNDHLTGIKTLQEMPVWLNGGYFVLRPEVFDYVPENGDLVAFDTDLIGPYGFCADLSRTWLCGDKKPTNEQRDLFRVAADQISHNTDLMRPGISFRDLVERSAVPPGDCFPTRYGVLYHGVGLADEYPTLPHASDWTSDTPDGVLEPGMVLCVESYIGRLGGREGVKIEEQILITESGNEQLSTYPLDTRLLG